MADRARLLAERRARLPATAVAIDALHGLLDAVWSDLDGVGDRPEGAWRHQFASALVEIGTNVVHHGHPIESMPNPVLVRVRAYPDRVEACMLDRGVPFVEPVGGPADFVVYGRDVGDVADLPESGYGLPLARAALDTLEYRRSWHGTNFWYLVKRRSAARAPTGS